MPISILPEETINKIAAGEVVERPANVVKELIENSLDAGSTSIEVELKGAGRRLIRVRDNGSGIPADEIKLAVTRHATSKITGFDDLEKLHSMGFRGEALPSIAAVSNMLIQSKTPGPGPGWELALSGGKIKKEAAWAGAAGTNIEVAELFFNTPVREKFLKSETTERNRILKIIEELSLAWYKVSFKVISDGRTALEAPRTNIPLERIIDVLGRDFASTLIHAEVKHPFLKIDCYITKRENSLPVRSYQFLFINGRPVNFGKSLMHALYEAYRENLPSGRHPGAVIFLEIDPSEIDVNIHPTKREVRFSKEQQIYQLVYTSIKSALNKTPATELNVPCDTINAGQAVRTELGEPRARVSYSEAIAKSGIFAPAVNSSPLQPEFAGHDTGSKRIIGQAFNLYIIARDSEGLLIIDQHAAAERIRYEKYIGQWQSKDIVLQPLLFPENIELSPSLFSAASAGLELLREAGWEIGEFGTNTVRVSSVPAVLGNNFSAGNALKEMLEALSEEKKIPAAEKIEKLIRTACHLSIKGGDALPEKEASNLFEELLKCRAPNTCPHGRPTMLRISRGELDKHFSRK